MVRKRWQRGVTVIELVAVVAIAAITLTLAVPGLRSLILENQLTASTNSLITAINLARSEAVRRAARVTLCKSANGSSCTNAGSYQQGWLVFADANENGQVDGGEDVVRERAALADDIHIVTGTSSLADYVSFVSDGTARQVDGDVPAAVEIKVCREDRARLIKISAIGRSSVEVGTCAGP